METNAKAEKSKRGRYDIAWRYARAVESAEHWTPLSTGFLTQKDINKIKAILSNPGEDFLNPDIRLETISAIFKYLGKVDQRLRRGPLVDKVKGHCVICGEETHDERFPYVCVKCDRALVSRYVLRTPYTAKNTGPKRKQTQCINCGAPFVVMPGDDTRPSPKKARGGGWNLCHKCYELGRRLGTFDAEELHRGLPQELTLLKPVGQDFVALEGAPFPHPTTEQNNTK